MRSVVAYSALDLNYEVKLFVGRTWWGGRCYQMRCTCRVISDRLRSESEAWRLIREHAELHRKAMQPAAGGVSHFGQRTATTTDAPPPGDGWERDLDAAPALPRLGPVAKRLAATPCPEGFHWIGQPAATCHACGLPAWDHDGMACPANGRLKSPYDDTTWVLQPWKPGEREAVRRKWDPTYRPAEDDVRDGQ